MIAFTRNKRTHCLVYIALFMGMFRAYAQPSTQGSVETAPATLAVSGDELVEVRNIYVHVKTEENAKDVTHKKSRPTMPRRALLMQAISFREGDLMRFRDLRRKMYFSLLRLHELPYFHSINKGSDMRYEVHEDTSSPKRRVISVHFTLYSRETSLLFGFDNAYGIIGVYLPTGLDIVTYAGLNRQELDLTYQSLPFSVRNGRYSRSFFNIGMNIYNYWLLPMMSNAPLSAQSLLYGASTTATFVLTPTVQYSLGTGFTGQYTIKKQNPKVPNEELLYNGLPTVGETSLAVDIHNSLRYALIFGNTGVYKSIIDMKFPYIVGFATLKPQKDLELYDILGLELTLQGAFVSAPVHHALRMHVGFITSFIKPTHRPFYAKANINEGFYNKTASTFTLERRGVYPHKTSIGDMAYALSLEYLIGGQSNPSLSFSGFLFYDLGAAANTYEELLTNTRHTIGPGVLFHFLKPLAIDCRFSLGFGGHLLGNPDGRSLSFSFSVSTH